MSIQLWQLEALLQGQQCQGFTRDGLSNYSQTLSQTLVPMNRRNIFYRTSRAAVRKLDENWQQYWVMLLWVLAMFGLFLWKFFQYQQRSSFHVMGYCLCTAKGAAETLKLNMALILLPVCRNTITWLRSTILGSIIPFDDNINFHKVPLFCIVLFVFDQGKTRIWYATWYKHVRNSSCFAMQTAHTWCLIALHYKANNEKCLCWRTQNACQCTI